MRTGQHLATVATKQDGVHVVQSADRIRARLDGALSARRQAVQFDVVGTATVADRSPTPADC